jgi:hypothetical protein
MADLIANVVCITDLFITYVNLLSTLISQMEFNNCIDIGRQLMTVTCIAYKFAIVIITVFFTLCLDLCSIGI